MGNCYTHLCGVHEKKTYPETRGKFEDGVRTVDFVLTYYDSDNDVEHIEKREIFEDNLEKEGLELEVDSTQHIHFVKIHAPLEVLWKYAEVLQIKLPMKRIPGQEKVVDKRRSSIFRKSLRISVNVFGSPRASRMKFASRPYRIYYPYSRHYHHLFDWDKKNFLDGGVRNSILNFILEREYFDEHEETTKNFGIKKLLHDHVYDSAYTLHKEHDRDVLLREWANLRKWSKNQPLDLIKDYFGPKVGLYYAFLGFYTQMLIPMSIFGIICFLYGLFTLKKDKISYEICNDNKTTLMCPLCDRGCDFWQLEDICKAAEMNSIVDNNMTVIYAFITSVWAVTYLEVWKRYSGSLVHRWGLTGPTQVIEQPRKEYLSKVQEHIKWNKDTNEFEPEVSYWSTKFLPSLTSYSIMVLFICISLIWVFTMIIYRMAQTASHSILGGENAMTYKIFMFPMTVSIIGLTVNCLLHYIYQDLATFLTNFEYCRTKTEYDESLTVKLYTFQFVNFYSWLFYIAFVKGKFVGNPAKYNRIFGLRQQECIPGGCLMELCMQLGTTMLYKQALGGIKEMSFPYIKRTIRRMGLNFGLFKGYEAKRLKPVTQWAEEYHLLSWTIYSEYLEMALQFGFITLFGLAFPLAPLFALINNVFEMRLDGLKMLSFYKRPIAQRVKDIGVWYNLLLVLTKIAVFSNAMIIAFSTNFIPKLIYRITTRDYSLEGYLNFTLAYFNTADFETKPVLASSRYENATSCRYTQIRNPPSGANPYGFPLIYWKILAARLAFIVIFENVIFMLQGTIAWAIPDLPRKIRNRIRRETSLLVEHIMEFEKDGDAGIIAKKAAEEARKSAAEQRAARQMASEAVARWKAVVEADQRVKNTASEWAAKTFSRRSEGKRATLRTPKREQSVADINNTASTSRPPIERGSKRKNKDNERKK